MCHTRSEDSFERGVNAGQQSADSVADAGCFTGEIVIETDQHTELGECVITGIDSSQRVGHGPGRVGDDERIPRISFGLPWIQICDAAHGQTR